MWRFSFLVGIFTCFFNGVLWIKHDKLFYRERDYFVLSKDHGALSFYPVLTKKGYLNEELFWEYRCREEMVFSIPPELGIPRIDAVKGSLGHGTNLFINFVLSFLMQWEPFLVFALVGNEGLNERSHWEGLLLEVHYKRDNRTLIMDHNKLQLSGCIEDIHPLVPLWEKFCTFSWKEVVEVVNGQNLKMIWDVFSQAKIQSGCMRFAVNALVVKGRGIGEIESKIGSHYCVLS